ncbi:hypothetical protein CANARDRAFT_26683 [[Candida] arabinofermentans NRRL YB-2248]|uniref:Protein FMP42 n=1 Tax=[Candida] arabinofermentans NRRL YB-2248 TaxID=983967 RepID=A0A1E4T6H1_9ASCO|nr:hypothetical protein CANARDRAFT_26683 [[Candida] arabinofermentans NRRL YB-2248]
MPSTETTPLLPSISKDAELPSLKKRILQVACSIIWCLFAAGPIFGFAALKPVLVAQGVYKEVCEVGTNWEGGELCPDRDLKLNLMFTMGAVITNATALIVGRILDTYGPKVTGIIGSFVIFMAALCLANGKAITLFDGYLVGYVSLAFGGPFVFISCFQLANSFPGNSGLILALLTGSFDSSSALFLIYRVVFQNDYVKDLTLKKFFSYYLVVPVFILVCQLTIMPSESYKTVEALAKISETGLNEEGLPLDPEDERYTSEQVAQHQARSRRPSVKSVYEEMAEANMTAKTGNIFGALHSKSIKEQMSTPWFYLMCLFTTIQMLRINYFVATIRSQMEFYFDDEDIAITINKFFDIALPVGGILSIPFIGVLLDNFKTLTVLTILLCVSLTIGICGVIPYQFLQFIGIMLLVLYRPFYYTAVSDYCAKVFGFKTFGTVYGAIICFSGFCNLLQTFLDKSTHTIFHMNPNPVNFTLVGLTLVFGFAMVTFIKTKEDELEKDQLFQEAANSEVVEIPQ